MKKLGLQKTIDNLPKVSKDLKQLTGRSVLVGVPSTKNTRGIPAKTMEKFNKLGGKKPSAKLRRALLHDSSGVSNATIAAIQDKGSDLANIPPRPFLKAGVLADRKNIEARMAAVGRAALRDDPTAVDRALHAVGLEAANAVKRKITAGPFVRLAPGTLRARRSRGRKGTKPLIDTGQLRNSISYVVK